MTIAQYIDKSAIVAEIESLKRVTFTNFDEGVNYAAQTLLETIATLEVKEVNFETEWKKYFEHKGNLATVNVKDLAKHFFELGLKTKGE